MQKKRLTLKEAAEMTGLSEYALRMLQKRGQLSFIKVGVGRGRVFFDLDKLNEELEALSEQSKVEQAKAFEQCYAKSHPEILIEGRLSSRR